MTPGGAAKPGPSAVLAGALLGVGVVVAVASLVVIVVRAARVIAAPSTSVPATIHRHLASGKWVVFEIAGAHEGSVIVSVSGPRGPVPVRSDDASETLTRNGTVYTGTLEFNATGGDYTVTLQSAGPGRIILARSLGDTVLGLVPFIVAAVVGGMLGVSGVALLIIGTFRRSRAGL